MEKKEILSADDSRTVQLWMEENLPKWGYTVRIAKDGDEAWNILNGINPPSLVLLDWEMPGLTGPEICRKLRAKTTPYYVYVILITQRNRKEEIVEALDSGADDFISKPFDPMELKSRISVGLRVLAYEKEIKEKEFLTRVECYKALTELAETRDQETGEHLRRLSYYSSLICKKMDLPESFTREMEIFAPMHDIGKVGIPDGILLAPRRLSEKEMEIIKSHTVLGWQILSGKESLETAAEIAWTHHERWNGTGYPRQMKGENIPLSGRIVSVCDVYDALRSRRIYKPAWPHSKAMEWIVSQKGLFFDPAITDIFTEYNGEFDRIFEEHKDPEENVY